MQHRPKNLRSTPASHSRTVAHAKREPSAPADAEPLDADALRALAWLARGEPESEIVFDEIAPRQTTEELAQFKPHSYVREPRKKEG